MPKPTKPTPEARAYVLHRYREQRERQVEPIEAARSLVSGFARWVTDGLADGTHDEQTRRWGLERYLAARELLEAAYQRAGINDPSDSGTTLQQSFWLYGKRGKAVWLAA